MHPVISVLLPVYNAAPTLAAAVKSILRQDFQDFELLIVDDGSSDKSRSIAQSLARDDTRIKVLESSKDGLVRALNLGISVAKGVYIARMDSDDLSRSDRFRLQLDEMRRHANLAVVGSFMREIDEAGRVTRRRTLPQTHASIQRHLRLSGNALVHSSVMMRRDAVLRFGGYRDAFRHAEDYDLWLRMAEFYELSNIPEFLLDYRRTAKGVSASNMEQQCLSSIGARKASEFRIQGKPDPSDGISLVTRQALLDWGVTEQFLNSSMQEWLESTGRSGTKVSLRRWEVMHPRLSMAIHTLLSRHAMLRTLHHSVSRLWRR